MILPPNRSVSGGSIRRVSDAPVEGSPPPAPTCQAGGRPPTAGGPQGEPAPLIRSADPVLAGTALRTHRPKRWAAVFHRHPLDVPGRGLGPALQTVDFHSVRRCRHGQLLHRLASIQLLPARLRHSRMFCRSIVAPRAQGTRQGRGTPGQSRVPFPCHVWTTRVMYGQPEPLGSCRPGFSIRSHRMTGPKG